MRVGIFELVDPPPGGETLVRDVLAACDYPWARVLPAIRRDPDGAVLVKWDQPMPQSTTGLFYGGTYEVHLHADVTRADAFVFAHEAGHLVDRATLRHTDRQALTDLMHRGPFVQLGHYNHDHPDAGHVSEGWTDRSNHYPSMLNECYADLWVAAFCPDAWNGNLPGTRQHWPRFVHWTEDLDAVRRLTLQRRIDVFTDIADNTHREAIEWAAAQGLVSGYSDGTFRPAEPITRAQLATILHRQATK